MAQINNQHSVPFNSEKRSSSTTANKTEPFIHPFSQREEKTFIVHLELKIVVYYLSKKNPLEMVYIYILSSPLIP